MLLHMPLLRMLTNVNAKMLNVARHLAGSILCVADATFVVDADVAYALF